MTDSGGFDDPDAIWRQCEVAWAGWLGDMGHAVTHLNAAVGNHPRTAAPMITVRGKSRRAPDLQSTVAGRATYWEVKYRGRSETDALTGTREHWMSYVSYQDYLEVADATGSDVVVVLHEAATSTAPGRWLRASVGALLDAGRESVRFGRGGEELAAWVWPASAMEVVRGPRVDMPIGDGPLLPDEGSGEPLEAGRLAPVERRIRKTGMGRAVEPARSAPAEEAAERVLSAEPVAALDVLRRSLGIPALPRYSVTRVGTAGVDVSQLLGLLHYGIRLFLVSGPAVNHDMDAVDLQAFKESRLLEWSVLDAEPELACWAVDGRPSAGEEVPLDVALDAADAQGAINVGQYRIVHADPRRDVLVTAGAGTGKTETMAERLVFLLSTVGGGGAEGDETDLRPDEVSLVTFTRDAAREMRARLARTLMLRRRLCRASIQPLAWLLQLSGAEVSTIHSLARRAIAEGGGARGLSPGFSVSQLTMPFRSLVHRDLSSRLTRLLEDHPSDAVPAAHLWLEHISAVWESLANNGVDLLRLDADGVHGHPAVAWGSGRGDVLNRAVCEATRAVIESVADRFRELCVRENAVPTGQLVPTALSVLSGTTSVAVRRPRFLFIDEFQDTDALQMDLLLAMGHQLGARLFVVGDAKQGIYRFRGAEGNAFAEVRARVAAAGREPFLEFPLTRNFRSGEKLLSSLHPIFTTWGQATLLPYVAADRLRPVVRPEDASSPVQAQLVQRDSYQYAAADVVAAWRAADPKATIAVLCRLNSHAISVQKAIRQANGSCELRVGGSFFTTEAVQDLRVLLDAVLDPLDSAALLELTETRWSGGLFAGHPPPGPDPAGPDLWRNPLETPAPWRDRLASVGGGGSFSLDDLEPLRARVNALRARAEYMPVMQWIVECAAAFSPEACERQRAKDDQVERQRYARCLDHVVTLLDAQFADSAISLDRVQGWLRLQIATNRSEDEPTDPDGIPGKTTALTVHKAKGLEFDAVLIPSTWVPFGPPKRVKTHTAVLKDGHGAPRIAWRWKDQLTFTNVGDDEDRLWHSDEQETAREEARLLYVALTRAKERAVVFMNGQASLGKDPTSWGQLLHVGGVRP